MDEQLSQIMTLSSHDLIHWCRERKKALELSNAKLSELTGVPIGTIDRIMSGNYSEYKYSSIQPLIAVLIGFNEKTPLPQKNDKSQSHYYYNTIEGYKLVLEQKNQMINTLEHEIDMLKREVNYLTEDNKKKQNTIESIQMHVKWMEQVINNLQK